MGVLLREPSGLCLRLRLSRNCRRFCYELVTAVALDAAANVFSLIVGAVIAFVVASFSSFIRHPSQRRYRMSRNGAPFGRCRLRRILREEAASLLGRRSS